MREEPIPSSRPALGDTLEACRRRLSANGRKVLVLTGEIYEGGALGFRGSFDAAWIAPTHTEGLDVASLARQVAQVLGPGAPVACSIPGCWALPALVEKALRGTGEWAGPRRARVEGRDAPCLSAGAWREGFGPEFSWHHVRAVDVLLPSKPDAAWAERHALWLGLLAAGEQASATWPLVRSLGDRILLEGTRR